MADATYDVGDEITLEGIITLNPAKGSIERGSDQLLISDPTGWNDTDPILVVGAGPLGADLVTTVTARSGYHFTLALAAETSVAGADVGKPSASTVVLKVQPPTGSAQTVTANPVSTGRYRGAFIPTVAGEHWYRFGSTGTAVAQGEKRFVVRERRVP